MLNPHTGPYSLLPHLLCREGALSTHMAELSDSD